MTTGASGMSPKPEALKCALACFPVLRSPVVAPLAGGLINRTFAVSDDSGAFVLQRVHPVFSPDIHDNILAVTRALERAGLVTPMLQLTRDGRPFADLRADGVWRLMTRIPGTSFAKASRPAQVRSAAALVACFHAAVQDLKWEFRGVRQGVHDLAHHLASLRSALDQHSDHRLHGDVSRLAHRMFSAAERIPKLPLVEARVSHGDLKFDNVLFAGEHDDASERAICLVDLDTVGRMPLHFELGDAWRSWCNGKGEDEHHGEFDLKVFAAFLDGYFGSHTVVVSANEREALLYGVEWISLELAARFASDSLCESYFGWDEQRFPAAGEHNLVRAKGQFALYEATLATRGERRILLASA